MQPNLNNSVYFDLEKFTNAQLGDVRRLVDLSFYTMRTIPHVYDFALMDCMDCDDTNFAWEIYHRLWGLERMPESPPMPQGWVQPVWRGDTINSFRTLFGREILLENIAVGGGDDILGFKGLRRFGVEKELFEKVHEFWYTYHCVGMTQDLDARLEKHNSGQVSHTSKFRPWEV